MSDVLVLALVLLLVASGYAAGRVHAEIGYRSGYRLGYRQGQADAGRHRPSAAKDAVARPAAVETKGGDSSSEGRQIAVAGGPAVHKVGHARR